MTLIYAVLIFCLLIFVHEFGHFVTAKMCGIKVNEFAIGMGPALFQKQKGETLYSVRAIPIGGFCAMEGEDEDSEDERAFNNQPAWQRAIVLAAGSIMNLLTAIVLMIIIAFYMGQATTTIDVVSEGSPAYEAGIMAGDEVVKINDIDIEEWSDLQTIVGENDGDAVTFTVLRNGSQTDIEVIPEYDKEAGRSLVGVTPTMARNPVKAVRTGVSNTWDMTVMMYDLIGQLFTGDVSAKELSGPVGIVYVVNDSAKMGLIYVVYLAALLSLNLAVINLLPFPALDGGRLLFLVIRKITGKRVTDEMEGKIHFIGIMLLFALMIYVTWNDIIRFILPIFS